MISALAFRADGCFDRLPYCLPSRLGSLKGWRRAWVLMLLGALAALALPPVGWLPVLLISVPGLIWAWDGARSYKAAFLTAWFWALGFYSAGFYWIANALLTDAARFGWMIPFATLGLGGLVAAFPAAGFAAVYGIRPTVNIIGRGLFCTKPSPGGCESHLNASSLGPARIIWIAIFWTVSEWLRTFILTGFPWNPMGSVWDASLPVLQAGALFGVHGLSFMTMLCFGLVASVPTLSSQRLKSVVLLMAVAIPVGLGLWGYQRLSLAETDYVPGIRLRMVQPAATQAEKWHPENREHALRELVDLSRSEGFQGITHVIWPESSAPFDLVGDAGHRYVAALAAPPNGLVLAGAPRIQTEEKGSWHFWNSLIAIDDHGQVQGTYDKAHLVPFGEYVPLRGVLPIPRVVASMGDFSPGPGPRTLVLPGLPPVGPAICYESIFPGAVVAKGAERPEWMVVITNDGWFGNSAGPYQHFAAARMRAIEEGLPVARAANTGISGVIDAYGRTIAKLDLGQKGIVDSNLPVPVVSITPYGQWSDYTVLVLLALSALIAYIIRRYN